MTDMFENSYYSISLTLTLKFDLLLKNFDLGCDLVMVVSRQASLASDNSELEY